MEIRDSPSPRILRITLDTEADRFKLVVVRILLASLSCIGKPGIAVAYPPPPSAVSGEYIEPPCEGVLSRSTYDGVSEVTGVSETNGAAGLEVLRLRVLGRSGTDLFELFELEFCNDGRRASTVAVGPF